MIRIVAFSILLLLRELREFGYLLRHHYFFLPWIDVAFWYRCSYFLRSPHHVARTWMKQNGIEIHKPNHSFTYGSTPLRTWDLILSRVGITKGTVVFDVGCGTGLGCFFLARRLQSKVVGVEYSNAFMKKAAWLHARIRGVKPYFVHGDARSIDYCDADVVYLFSTTFTEELYQDLTLRMKETLVEGALVLSVSAPLPSADSFFIEDQFDVPYFFGFCTVFVHRFLGANTVAKEQETTLSFSDILSRTQDQS